jgi:hypothetical protein
VKIRSAALVVVTAAGLAWASAIVAAPLRVSRSDRGAGWYASGLVYAAAAIVCHQRPERSFHTAGIQWPVCARCTGLYLGGALGLLLWPGVRHLREKREGLRDGRRLEARPGRPHQLRAVVLAVAAPTLATLFTGAIGFFDPPNAWRAALALPLGALAGAVVSAVLFEDLR